VTFWSIGCRYLAGPMSPNAAVYKGGGGSKVGAATVVVTGIGVALG
jgi:hypothetical protein